MSVSRSLRRRMQQASDKACVKESRLLRGELERALAPYVAAGRLASEDVRFVVLGVAARLAMNEALGERAFMIEAVNAHAALRDALEEREEPLTFGES